MGFRRMGCGRMGARKTGGGWIKMSIILTITFLVSI